jgi:predicted alpha/beta superfamily hydrolase
MKNAFAPASATHRHAFGKLVGLLGIMVLLALTSASALAQVPAVSKLTIKSKVLGEDRLIYVRTPEAYATSKRAYPVIYMTDGDAHLAHTSSTVEFLARNGRMSEMIVVGIPNTDRTRDLTPTRPKQTGATGAPQFPTAGGADNFLKFIETELMPEIEKSFRVLPYRVLAGHSLGGLFAVHSLVTRPELFQAYVAVSPSLQWDNQLVVKQAEDFFKTRKELNTVLYMSLGNEPGEIEDSFHQFKQLLARSKITGFDWEAQEMPDEDHGSVVLRSHYFAMRKIYDGWQMPRDPGTGTIAGGMKAVDAHYQKLSEKFHYAIPVPENLINQVGYQYLFADQNDEAIAVFKLQVERYPESPNVYDSLGEAYEKTGHLDLATPLYEKAQALGKQNNDPNAQVFYANFVRASDKLKQAAAKTNGGAQVDAAKKNDQ